MSEVFDVLVVGAGPGGTQAAVSAAHQMRHVLLVDASKVSRRRGRAYWSKTVKIEDAPVFAGITGIEFAKALREWTEGQPERAITRGSEERMAGIRRADGFALDLERLDDGSFRLTYATEPLSRDGTVGATTTALGRTVVVASGFEDGWPDIEINEAADRMYRKYQLVYRYAGNSRGWHLCIRCDGHLHVDERVAIVGVGDYIFDVVQGAQDFTDRITVLTNGRPHGMSPHVLAALRERGTELEEGRIEAHIGQGLDLLGFRMEDGRELFFDGFFVDEGLKANDEFLHRFDVAHAGDGLLRCSDDHEVLDSSGEPIPGMWAAGDIVAGERNLIASAFASGQDAGLEASDSLRRWAAPSALGEN